MPPRYAYWTIIADGLPTAFRAAERDELMPTFQRLREKHPDAQMKWFARGKLWESPEEARRAGDERRERRDDDRPRRPRESGERSGERRGGDVRGKDWRPGGEHRDPRQKYKDAKKARNVERRHEKFARKHGGDRFADRPPRMESRGNGPRRDHDRDRAPREKPHGDKLLDSRQRGPAWTRDEGRGPRDRKPEWRDRPPREKPHGDKLFARRDQRATPRAGDRKPEWRDRDRKPEWRDRDRNAEWRNRDDRQSAGGDRGSRNRDERQSRGGDSRWRNDGERQSRGGDRDWRNRDDRQSAGGDRNWRAGDKPAPREKPHGDKLLDSRKRGPAWTRDEGRGPRDRKPEWRDRPPREKPHGDKLADRAREVDWRGRPRPYSSGTSFARGGSAPKNSPPRGSSAPKGSGRNQGTEEPPAPPRPRGPNREPRPGERPEPSPPPRPREPEIRPYGPPERGRLVRDKKPRDRGRE
jgi:hypothetical protein